MDSYEKEDKKWEKATNHDKDRKQQKRKKSEEKETREKRRVEAREKKEGKGQIKARRRLAVIPLNRRKKVPTATRDENPQSKR